MNERQIKAVLYVAENGRIDNKKYKEMFDESKATATRDLSQLVEEFIIFEKIGITGAGTEYILKS